MSYEAVKFLIVAIAIEKTTITSFIHPSSQLDVAHGQLTQCTFSAYVIQACLDSHWSDLLSLCLPCSFASNSFTMRLSALVAHFFHAPSL